MESYFGTLRITALGPSVALRNRYATYGIDMNNASIVLRLENCKDDVVVESERYRDQDDPEILRDTGDSVVILGADAEFDNRAKIAHEYPHVERTSKHDPLVKKTVNLLSCAVVKVSHYGSMHSAPLDVYERMSPALAILSSKQKLSSVTHRGQTITRTLHPHPVAIETLLESGCKVLSTDGYTESMKTGGPAKPGTIVVAVSPGNKPRSTRLSDDTDTTPQPPTSV